MWLVRVACSDCDEEAEVVAQDLDDVDREACPCGYSYVVLTVSSYEAVEPRGGEVVPLPRRPRLPQAA